MLYAPPPHKYWKSTSHTAPLLHYIYCIILYQCQIASLSLTSPHAPLLSFTRPAIITSRQLLWAANAASAAGSLAAFHAKAVFTLLCQLTLVESLKIFLDISRHNYHWNNIYVITRRMIKTSLFPHHAASPIAGFMKASLPRPGAIIFKAKYRSACL